MLAVLFALLLVFATSCGDSTTPAADQSPTADDMSPADDDTDESPAAMECTDPQTVSFGIISPSAAYWLALYADAAGLFEEHCVTYDPVQIPNASNIIAAVEAGELHVGGVPTDVGIGAVEEGVEVRLIASVQTLNNAGLIASGDITDFDALRGTTIGVAGITTGSTLMVQRLLADHGLEEGDYDLVASGGTSERTAALRGGAFQATWAHPPQDLQLAEEGYNVLGTLDEAFPEFMYAGLFSKASWLESDAETAKRFMTAWYEAAERFQDPAYQSEYEQVLIDAVGISQELATATYEKYRDTGAMSPDGGINVPGMFKVMELMAELDQLDEVPDDVSAYVDLSVWSEVTGKAAPSLTRS